MLLSRRVQKESDVGGLRVLADLELQQLFNALRVTPVQRVQRRSSGGDIALQAVRHVVSLNSETRAAVP
jgi:hypothetical protein